MEMRTDNHLPELTTSVMALEHFLISGDDEEFSYVLKNPHLKRLLPRIRNKVLAKDLVDQKASPERINTLRVQVILDILRTTRNVSTIKLAAFNPAAQTMLKRFSGLDYSNRWGLVLATNPATPEEVLKYIWEELLTSSSDELLSIRIIIHPNCPDGLVDQFLSNSNRKKLLEARLDLFWNAFSNATRIWTENNQKVATKIWLHTPKTQINQYYIMNSPVAPELKAKTLLWFFDPKLALSETITSDTPAIINALKQELLQFVHEEIVKSGFDYSNVPFHILLESVSGFIEQAVEYKYVEDFLNRGTLEFVEYKLFLQQLGNNSNG